MTESAEIEALAEALCREYHPMHWDVTYRNRSTPCQACLIHAARLVNKMPDCEGWACQSCGADNFIPGGFARITPLALIAKASR